MKLDIKKQTSNTIITQAYHSRCSSWNLPSNARIAWEFWILFTHQPRWKTKTMPSKIGFPTLTSTDLSTEKVINKLSMNNRRLLIAAVFHFVHPVEKDSEKHHKLTQNSVSFSCQSKQVSRLCCISFTHELTCQILTNQSIKIGRRARPTRDHGKKRSSPPVF